MITYLKNMEGWKHKDLKSKDFDSIKELFDKLSKRAHEIVSDEEEVAIDAIPLAIKPPSIGRIVGIKNLLNVVSITVVLIDVNVAQSKLLMLEEVTAASGIKAAGEEVSIAELVSTAYDSYLDVKEDQRTSNEFMADLNAEYHERALLANQKRFYKRSGRDERSTRIRAFMAITKDEQSIGKADARSGQWVDITMKKDYLNRYSKESGPKVVFRDDSLGDTEGYGSVNCNGITFTQEIIFNQNDEVVLIAPRRRDVYVIDMSSFNKESNACFFSKALQVKMENLNEIRENKLRSNNGTEFRNHKLEEFFDEKGISHNFSSPCTPEQNGVAERRNKTLIEAARTIERSDISYFHVFGCFVYIHNHMDHLGKFDEKADDGFFLGYSLVAKAFRVFNIRRQEMEETVHITFNEDDEAISQCSKEGDDSVSTEDPPEFTEADDHPAFNELDQLKLADILESTETQNVIIKPISDTQSSPITISPSAEVILQTLFP
ncbi:retrovirus-related pol polyprotein from transposon TNT 1-94 [Tanacetum coccineum]